MLVLVLLIAGQMSAMAASGTVDVRFVVKNQQGAYKGVTIQFGNNTKVTGSNGAAKFRLKNIPVTTMVNAFLVDPHVPAGYNCDVNLALGAHQDVQVNSTSPGDCSLNIMYTENTKTIVIEFYVGHNTNYGYSNATFEQKLIKKPSQSTAKPNNPAPTQPAQPQHPDQHDPQPQHPDGHDPDLHHDEHHDPHHAENDFPMDEHHGEYHDDRYMEDEYYGEPSIFWTIPVYAWIGILLSIVLITVLIVLIVVVSRRKRNT